MDMALALLIVFDLNSPCQLSMDGQVFRIITHTLKRSLFLTPVPDPPAVPPAAITMVFHEDRCAYAHGKEELRYRTLREM